MDKWQSLQSFWESFSLPAYDENSVPDDAVMPYITYSAEIASFEEKLLLSASIWYHSLSWADISQKADQIAQALSGYHIVKIDNGYLFMTQGNPFAQRIKDTNDSVKRIYLNITAEFFTAY